MKQHKLRISFARTAIAIAAAGGLACVHSARAQAVTGDANLDNVTATAVYPGWGSDVLTDGPSGYEVQGLTAYGSAYFAVPAVQQQTMFSGDNQATLVMTVNNALSSPGIPSGSGGQYWLGISFYLDDPNTSVNLGGYSGEFGYTGAGTAVWNGNTVTETVPLSGTLLSDIAAGGDTITGFNLQLDPAVYPTAFEDVTFNSLTLSQATPEPSTFALVGSGIAAFWSFRRRNK